MKIFIVGGTGQGRLCHHMLSKQGHTMPYLFDQNAELPLPWDCLHFSDEALIPKYAGECDGFLVCISRERGEARARYSRLLLGLGLAPVSAVHPTIHLGDTVRVGRGLQAMPHAVVNEFTTIGDWCILNTNSTVDHDCTVGDGVHIMGGAAVTSDVVIHDYATVGTNATILPRITIGRNAFVGAGAVVTKDVPDGAVVTGVPARAASMRSSIGVAGPVESES
jgi:sugar O-acyltransferase (sialic acid O-acetyltransferase NeuD family)